MLLYACTTALRFWRVEHRFPPLHRHYHDPARSCQRAFDEEISRSCPIIFDRFGLFAWLCKFPYGPWNFVPISHAVITKYPIATHSRFPFSHDSSPICNNCPNDDLVLRRHGGKDYKFLSRDSEDSNPSQHLCASWDGLNRSTRNTFLALERSDCIALRLDCRRRDHCNSRSPTHKNREDERTNQNFPGVRVDD
jgi:hypothetical protein